MCASSFDSPPSSHLFASIIQKLRTTTSTTITAQYPSGWRKNIAKHTRRKTHPTLVHKQTTNARGRPQTEFARSSPSVGQVHLVVECVQPDKSTMVRCRWWNIYEQRLSGPRVGTLDRAVERHSVVSRGWPERECWECTGLRCVWYLFRGYIPELKSTFRTEKFDDDVASGAGSNRDRKGWSWGWLVGFFRLLL